MGTHSPNVTHCDTRVRVYYALSQEPSTVYKEATQSIDVKQKKSEQKFLFTFIEISRKLSHEQSPSRTFNRLFALSYKIQGIASNEVSKSLVSFV